MQELGFKSCPRGRLQSHSTDYRIDLFPYKKYFQPAQALYELAPVSKYFPRKKSLILSMEALCRRPLRAFIVLAFMSIFLSSCFAGNEPFVVQGISPKKQRQKIAFLQKKLEIAEKEQRKRASEVEDLKDELNSAQLALIHQQVSDYEKRGGSSNPFLEERQTLYGMIQEGPSPSAFAAQVELDRILRIITESSAL